MATVIDLSAGLPNARLAGVKTFEDLDRPGEHLWVLLGAVAVPDPERPTAEPPLGGELSGPGCVKCNFAYSRKLARRPCAGSLE